MFCTNLAGQVVTAVRWKTILSFAQNIIHIWIHIAFTEYHIQVTTDIGVYPIRKGGGARLGTKWFLLFLFCIGTLFLFVLLLILILCYNWFYVAGGGYGFSCYFCFVSRIYTMPIFAFDPRIYKMFLCPRHIPYQLPQVGSESHMRWICSPGNS